METSNEKVIIANTSGLVSLFIPGDHNHEPAVKAAKELRNEYKDILIPAAVFVEFLNILGRKVGHTAARAVLAELAPPFITLTIQANIPTVSLDIISLVASSCGYYRGHIEQHAAP